MSAESEKVRRSDMLRTMAEMQDAYNRQVHPEWRSQGYAYYRAIWVECAELLDHFGWKWWKQQREDRDQVRLEIVDIWHFGLSDLIRAGALNGDLLTGLAEESGDDAGPESFRESVEVLANTTLANRRFEMGPFVRVMQTLPMSFNELFDLYVGKNVLNSFRQDNGYKTGGYRKLWQGREDNEHLVQVLDELNCAPADIPVQLYQALEARYRAGE